MLELRNMAEAKSEDNKILTTVLAKVIKKFYSIQSLWDIYLNHESLRYKGLQDKTAEIERQVCNMRLQGRHDHTHMKKLHAAIMGLDEALNRMQGASKCQP